MAKVFIEEKTLTDIGDAIRAKTGDSKKMSPASMVDAIEGIATGGGDIPEENFVLRGDQEYAFYNGAWTWFIDSYGDRITTEDIGDCAYMFVRNKDVTSIPFDFNFDEESVYHDASSMFYECHNLKAVGAFRNFKPLSMDGMFTACGNLRYLPEFENADFSYLQSHGSLDGLFIECNSLRSIPESLMNQLYVKNSNEEAITYGLMGLYALDELKGIYPPTQKTNLFSMLFLSRVKDITFMVQGDGTPYARSWSNQTLDLTYGIGYHEGSVGYITGLNSGITADKEVSGSYTYGKLKNDPDWFTCDIAYSRYDYGSACRTLATLPDTSDAGGGNIIKFKGDSGSATDAGAISQLTEEDVAQAVSFGWTVSLA